MIREAIDRILSLSPPNYHNFDGDPEKLVFTDKNLHLITAPKYPTINATTLMALQQFIGADAGEDRLIHVVSPEVVRFIGDDLPDGSRNVFCEIKLDLGINFQFGQYHDLQTFIICLQTCFVPTDSTTRLLEFLSSIVVGENGQFEDKGIYQNITVKTGITTIENKLVSPRVVLKPFRTFTEIDQPESTFLFRMKATNESKAIGCALFNCDGNAWRPVAMEGIAGWIRSNIKAQFPVLA